MNEIDQFIHSKKDVRNDLKLAKIELCDDFDIIENKVYGMPERIQHTSIQISASDRRRLIEEIQSDTNYHQVEYGQVLRDEMYNRPKKNTIVTSNYYCRGYITRESYFKIDDYVPTLTMVRLTERQHILEYEKIEK